MIEVKAVNSNDSNDTLGFSSSFLESLRAAQESDPELTKIMVSGRYPAIGRRALFIKYSK